MHGGSPAERRSVFSRVFGWRGPSGGLVRRPSAVFSRLTWGIADQGVSSLSNFALGIVVARALGAHDFGAFSLAYVTYGVVINAARGVGTDPLLVRFSGPASPRWREAAAASTATAAAVGLVASLGCIIAGFLFPWDVGVGLIALGFGLPGLMLQDSWRFTFFSVGRAASALVNDLLWGLLLLAALVGLLLTGRASVVTCVLAFGGTATLAACFGLLQSRIRPRPTSIRAWVVDHKHLGGRYLVENVSIGAAGQLRMFALGAFAGLAAVGDVRAAEILMGPFLVVLTGASQVAVPEAARVLNKAPRRLAAFCLVLGLVLAIAAAAWGGTITSLLPTGLGNLLLGHIWVSARPLLPPVILGMSMGGFTVAAMAGVRALGAAPRSLTAQLTNASLYAVAGGLGAFVAGARGSCWGVAIATTIGALVWWVQLHRALREFLARQGASVTQPDLSGRIAT